MFNKIGTVFRGQDEKNILKGWYMSVLDTRHITRFWLVNKNVNEIELLSILKKYFTNYMRRSNKVNKTKLICQIKKIQVEYSGILLSSISIYDIKVGRFLGCFKKCCYNLLKI